MEQTIPSKAQNQPFHERDRSRLPPLSATPFADQSSPGNMAYYSRQRWGPPPPCPPPPCFDPCQLCPPGPVGATGPQGATGGNGQNGQNGPRGDPGIPGTDGTPGSSGALGPSGVDGLPGGLGPSGPSSLGPSGPAGEVGPSGPATPGPSGPVGEAGPSGPDATFPPVTATEKVWVDKSGDDVTGDGSIANPFLTIQRAEDAIVDASPTKPYNINVGAGEYADTFYMKPWVWVIAEHRRQTIIPANIGLDPLFLTKGTSGPTARSGLMDLTLNGLVDFDLQTFGGTGNARLEIWHCGINQKLTFRARRDGDGMSIESAFINAGLTGRGGGNCLLMNCYIGNNVDIAADAKATGGTFWELANCYFNNGTLTLTSFPSPVSLLRVNLMNFANWPVTNLPSLFIVGPNTTVYSNGVPIQANVSFSGGASDAPAFFIRTTDLFSWGYTPAVPTQWALPRPYSAQQAVDRLAARVFALGGLIP